MIDQLMSQMPSESAQQAVTYPSLFLLVALGALVPVVPTGAVVSSAAVVAFHQTAPLALLYIFVVASFAAFLGDITLYWLGRRGSTPRTARGGWRRWSSGSPTTPSNRPSAGCASTA